MGRLRLDGIWGIVARMGNKQTTVRGFRQRGVDMTRIETFVDAAFAFSLTMLVISFDAIPRSLDELILALKNIPAYVLSFTQIAFFWYAHHIWSRRFGLDDGPTVLLSLAFVLVTLIYVYPLKVVFSAFAAWVSGNYLPYVFPSTTPAEVGAVFVIYGLGFVAMCLPIALLYRHAGKRADWLELSPWERYVTRWECQNWLILGAVGMASVLFASLMPERWRPFAGFFYASLAIIMPLFAVTRVRRARAMKLMPDSDK